MKKNFLFISLVVFFFVITTGNVLADPNDVVVAPFEAKERVLTVVEMAQARPLEMVLDADKAVGVEDPNTEVSIRGGSNISTTTTCQVTVQGHMPPIRSNNPDNAQVSFHVVRVPAAGPFCGQPGTEYLDADTSGPGGEPDCYVDIYDLRDLLNRWLIVDNLVQFATLSEQWLLCTDPANAGCL